MVFGKSAFRSAMLDVFAAFSQKPWILWFFGFLVFWFTVVAFSPLLLNQKTKNQKKRQRLENDAFRQCQVCVCVPHVLRPFVCFVFFLFLILPNALPVCARSDLLQSHLDHCYQTQNRKTKNPRNNVDDIHVYQRVSTETMNINELKINEQQ